MKPLTPAGELRMTRRARSLLANAATYRMLPVHLVAVAAGLLLRIAQHRGETAATTMTRLRLPASHKAFITRAGSLEFRTNQEPMPRVFKRFRDINQAKPSCVRGRHCTCAQSLQRARCGNYRRSDPAAGDFGIDAEAWLGEGWCKLKRTRVRARTEKDGP